MTTLPARRSTRNALFLGLSLIAVLVATSSGGGAAWGAEKATLSLTARYREAVSPEESAAGPVAFAERTRKLDWKASETAVIICDMWDDHWCKGASKRAAELAPTMNKLVAECRARGALIVHSPSGCIGFYKDHPARHTAERTPKLAKLPEGIREWCRVIPSEERGQYPVDQADGGCDCHPHCPHGSPWKRQIATIEIRDQDVISDAGDEIWSLLEMRGIQNVLVMGVHTNMCVLGRPFGLRNLARNGKNVVLVRDMTDTMYNSESWPKVNHFTGTDRIVEHIEKFVCPTVTSDQILGGKAFRFQEDRRPRLLIVSAEDEYKTETTLPPFAAAWLGRDFQVEFVFADPNVRHTLPGIEALARADLMLLSVRRRVLPADQMAVVRKFIESGKPVVGIRTASHAFSVRKGEPMPEGCVAWDGFDKEVLGCNYRGHHDKQPTDEGRNFYRVLSAQQSHPILTGVPGDELRTGAWLYLSLPLTESATELVRGRVEERQPQEPVAWTNTTAWKGRVFYTSLGHVTDFEQPAFQRMLANSIYWALDREIPKELAPVGPAPETARLKK